MSKHTPGPWECGLDHIWQVGAEDEIARVFTGNGYDMHLIAAAPEMLQALKIAVTRLKEIRYQKASPKQIEFLESVIAKANGERK